MKITIPSWLHPTQAVKDVARATRKRLAGRSWSTGYMHKTHFVIGGEETHTFCMMGGIWYGDLDRCPNGRDDWAPYDLMRMTDDEKSFVYLAAIACGWDHEKAIKWCEDEKPGSKSFENHMLNSAEGHVTSWNDSMSTLDYQQSKDVVMRRLRKAEKLVDRCQPDS